MNDQQFLLMTTPFRSGSALISRILNSHSQVALTADKVKFFRYCYNRFLPLNEKNILKMLDELSKRLLGRFDIELNVQACLERTSKPPDYASIYLAIFNFLHRDIKKPIIGEMESLAWTKIPIFLQMFPSGKALLIIRDLRDVVVSFKKLTFAPGNDYLIALFNVIDAMDHSLKAQKNSPDRFYGIRFEELKADPEREVKKICQFIGIDFEPEMLNEENWVDSCGEKKKKWANKKISSFHGENGVSQNPVGRWRHLISPEDLFLCEWIGAKQMEAFGMKREGSSPSQEVFDNAMKKINSSPLLRECFKGWCDQGTGVEKYPLDPFNPKNWDQRVMVKPELFDLNK